MGPGWKGSHKPSQPQMTIGWPRDFLAVLYCHPGFLFSFGFLFPSMGQISPIWLPSSCIRFLFPQTTLGRDNGSWSLPLYPLHHNWMPTDWERRPKDTCRLAAVLPRSSRCHPTCTRFLENKPEMPNWKSGPSMCKVLFWVGGLVIYSLSIWKKETGSLDVGWLWGGPRAAPRAEKAKPTCEEHAVCVRSGMTESGLWLWWIIGN